MAIVSLYFGWHEVFATDSETKLLALFLAEFHLERCPSTKLCLGCLCFYRLCYLLSLIQKEKVKVYIDEKYHHAEDPSIRPPQKPKSFDHREFCM